MNLGSFWRDVSLEEEGRIGYELAEELFPICRSITGDGVRKSLRLLRKSAPVELREVDSGTSVFDWTVPREWNIRDGFIRNSAGKKVVDFQETNLHVLNYSIPVQEVVSRAELERHLYSIPEKPDWIPYRTSYYKEQWGFCIRHSDREKLVDAEYEVRIDSSLEEGSLTYGECFLPGESEEEILISAHCCHPSLANDNLSGMVTAARLAHLLGGRKLRYSYRFVWVPGTIGAITWLARNEARLGRIRHGLVLSCLGDSGGFTYKRSRRGDAEIDLVMGHLLREKNCSRDQILDFEPFGYDERQYCSPGINLPMGCLMRTPHGSFPEYHTSADNLDYMQPSALGESLGMILKAIAILEGNHRYRNLKPMGEPQLGKRGLFVGAEESKGDETGKKALLWVLNLSDGDHSLLEIAQRGQLPFSAVRRAADSLFETGLLEEERMTPDAVRL